MACETCGSPPPPSEKFGAYCVGVCPQCRHNPGCVRRDNHPGCVSAFRWIIDLWAGYVAAGLADELPASSRQFCAAVVFGYADTRGYDAGRIPWALLHFVLRSVLWNEHGVLLTKVCVRPRRRCCAWKDVARLVATARPPASFAASPHALEAGGFPVEALATGLARSLRRTAWRCAARAASATRFGWKSDCGCGLARYVPLLAYASRKSMALLLDISGLRHGYRCDLAETFEWGLVRRAWVSAVLRRAVLLAPGPR